MDQVSEALRLAAELESFYVSEDVSAVKARAIAAELRRLHAENEAMKVFIERTLKAHEAAAREIDRAATEIARAFDGVNYG